MKGYNYTNIKISQLSDLVPESGGHQIRSVILTTWRSGSTFLGDILNSHPGNWYHYEPLLDFGIIQIRGPPHAETALNNIKQLLNCNYSGMDHYLEFWKTNPSSGIVVLNTRLYRHCRSHAKICDKPEFLTPMCKLFPFQSMKVNRLRLRLAEQLLLDPKLSNVQILLMVRDPRGTMQSRRARDWCLGKPDCWEPALLCADLTDDYNAAVKIAKIYPQRLRVIRYEDLFIEPYSGAKELLQFFNLNFHRNVKLFLDTHTKKNDGNPHSTFRDTKNMPLHWKNDLNYTVVQEIQSVCTEAMKLWGYLPALNESHLRDFNPMTEYNLK